MTGYQRPEPGPVVDRIGSKSPTRRLTAATIRGSAETMEVPVRPDPGPTVSFQVAGLPPVRTEAVSMLTAGHRQVERVRALLAAAEAAVRRTGWQPVTGPVRLSVVLRCPPGRRGAEAAVLLAGVGTVLQDKKRLVNIGLTRLGVLAEVALYADERQINEISYREVPDGTASYSVSVSARTDGS